MAQKNTQAAGSSQTTKVLVRSFNFLGWRLDLRRPATPNDCEQCHGAKRWRPPYTRFVIPCDLCTPSVLDLVPGQPLQAGAVSGPMSGTLGGNTHLPVKLYSLGAGISIKGEGSNLPLAEGAFELKADKFCFVIDPLKARVAHRLVTAVEGDISTVWHEVEAVDEKDLIEVGPANHDGCTSIETAILTLPSGWGKTTIAKRMGALIGCTHVIDEWTPLDPTFPGGLHLTCSEVA